MAAVGWIFDERVCIDCTNKIPDGKFGSLCFDCLCFFSVEELNGFIDQIERTFSNEKAYEAPKSV